SAVVHQRKPAVAQKPLRRVANANGPAAASAAKPSSGLQNKLATPFPPDRLHTLPRILESRPANHPKNAVPSIRQARPPAPQVYRPQPIPKVLQKRSTGREFENERIAPPVYRSAPSAPTMQRKTAMPSCARTRLRTAASSFP